MASESEKVMFEIYRDADAGGEYRVIFFTELDERNRDLEIGRAMQGEHFYDSFLKEDTLEAAKDRLRLVLERLNGGEALTAQQVEGELAAFLAR